MRHKQLLVIVATVVVITTPAFGQSWHVTRSRSGMTDDSSLVVQRLSDNTIRDQLDQPTQALIVVRCLEKKFEIYVVGRRVLDEGEVRVRWDDGEPVSVRADRSTDMGAMFVMQPDSFFLGGMLHHNRVRIELKPYDAPAVTASFPLAGLRTFLAEFTRDCPSLAADDSNPR